MHKLLAVTSAFAMALTASGADAAVLLQGTGLWGANTPTTAYSQSNRSFQFSFQVPDAFPADTSTATTTAITAFSYSLNGVAVAGAPISATFYQLASRGLFNLNVPGSTLSFYGVDIGSDGTVGPIGIYAFTSAIDGTETGSGTLTVTPATAVPEPAAWGMMILGFGLVGGALRRRRQNTSLSVTYA